MGWLAKVGVFVFNNGPTIVQGLRAVSELTDNEVDDNITNLADAALKCDLDEMEKAAIAVLESTREKKKKKVN